MKLKFTFIFFCFILSVISLNLKKKNENKKSFLQNKLTQSYMCKTASYRKHAGESCTKNDVCISNFCLYGKCTGYYTLKQLGDCCVCDYHCKSNHCSFNWNIFSKCSYKCTKD